jgi:hypothetical protein
MGTTYRFLALGSDLEMVYGWFAALPNPPKLIPVPGGQYLHFDSLGGLQPPTGPIDPKRSPIASLFVPEKIRSALWTAGELHFLATPLRETFPELHAISKRFAKWLREFECVFAGRGKEGEYDYYLEGSLRNFDAPIFALPEAFAALQDGQYFVSHGSTPDSVDCLCRSLRLRGVNCGPADA